MPLTHIPDELPALTADVVLFTVLEGELKVLVIQRRHPPFEGYWTVPGGFVALDESLDAAARRVLRDKAGVDQVYLEQLYTFGEPQRDPRARIVTVAYSALVGAHQAPFAQPGGQVQWHPAYNPPPLGFDHAAIVRYAVQRLRYKLEYTAIAFQLLPPRFTLTELQSIYEQILREPLDKRNFRRKVLATGVVEETDGYRSGDHRPARLYRFSEQATFEGQARRLFP